jgi:hypothetical protein
MDLCSGSGAFMVGATTYTLKLFKMYDFKLIFSILHRLKLRKQEQLHKIPMYINRYFVIATVTLL